MTNTPEFGGALSRVKIIEDFTDDDFGIIRTPGGPRVEIAVAHDGTAEGVHEAEHAAAAIAALPKLYEILQQATQAWSEEFDGDDEVDLNVSGADLVDWFGQWRLAAKAALAAAIVHEDATAGEGGGDVT